MSKLHLARRMAAEAAQTGAEVTERPGVRAGANRYVGTVRGHPSLAYRVVRFERVGGEMFVAVQLAGGALIGVTLPAADCSEWGPDEKALRAKVEAAVASGGPSATGATLDRT